MQKEFAPAEGGSSNRRGSGRSDCTRDHSEYTSDNPQSRPIYALRLEPLPGIDGPQALKALLKRARRNHGLRCVACCEEAAR